jgi:quinol monooxygenase YgiN
LATILAHIKVFAGSEPAFEDVIRPLYAATHRLEPHCRRYEYWRGAEPGTYYCLLSFRDFTAFMEHQSSEHHEAPDFGRLIERIRLEWVDPVPGASDLAPTTRQDLPADANQLMRAYATRMPAEVADWWQALR